MKLSLTFHPDGSSHRDLVLRFGEHEWRCDSYYFALDRGLDEVRTEVDGRTWTQEPFPYQGKCLQWLRIEYARLSDEERRSVDAILAGTGCEALVAPIAAPELREV